MAVISVIGTGYLGATHAGAMAELGHQVIGVDTSAEKIAALADGHPPFYEPDLPELIAEHVAQGNLAFSTDIAGAAPADIHFICVGTPQQPGSEAADLTQVFAAVRALLPHLTPGAVIVGKSTVPVGTAAKLHDLVRGHDPSITLLWNPEFLREGFAVEDTLRPDRIVIGAAQPADARPLQELYTSQEAAGTPIIITDFATAELVKVAANSFLATKISFINAMADVCDTTGADVAALAAALGHDERIGPKFLRAGIGFGGGCLPKDLRAFVARGDELGVGRSLAFLREVDELNMRRRGAVTQTASDMLDGSLLGSRVAVLGVAFKPDSDDIRDSPALNIAAALHLQGADVRVFDPHAMPNAARAFPTLTYVPDVETAVDEADLTLVLTEWRQFRELDPVKTGRMVRSRKMLDGRNTLDPQEWRAAGWQYRGIGIPTA